MIKSDTGGLFVVKDYEFKLKLQRNEDIYSKSRLTVIQNIVSNISVLNNLNIGKRRGTEKLSLSRSPIYPDRIF